MDLSLLSGFDATVEIVASSPFVTGSCAAFSSVAFGAALALAVRGRQMRRELGVAARDAAAQKDGHAFADSFAAYDRTLRLTRFVANPWIEYTRHMLASQPRGARVVATRRPSDAIPEESFASQLGSGNALPMTLFALGIFVSTLVLGASMLDGGLGLADWRELFHSAGMLVAAPVTAGAAAGFLFAAFDKLQLIPLRQSIRSWTEVLDAHVDVVERDRASVLQLRELVKNGKKIENVAPTVISGLEQVLEKQLSQKIGDRLESMLGELSKLRTEKGSEQVEGMRSLIEEFRGSLDQAVSEEMHELSKTLGDVTGSLREVPGQIGRTMAGVAQTALDSADSLATRLESSSERAAERMEKSFEGLERGAARLDQATVSSSLTLESVADLLAQIDRQQRRADRGGSAESAGTTAPAGAEGAAPAEASEGPRRKRVDARAFARVLRDALEAVPADMLTDDGDVLRYTMRAAVDELEALGESGASEDSASRRETLRAGLHKDFGAGLPEEGARTPLVSLPLPEVLEVVDLLARCGD